jgi:hypothetical protein
VVRCSSCSAVWSQGQFSSTAKCRECSGRGLESKCCICKGICGRLWKRSVTDSHSYHIAVFNGECGLSAEQQKQCLEKELDHKNDELFVMQFADLKH